jgi:hypothetical protein
MLPHCDILSTKKVKNIHWPTRGRDPRGRSFFGGFEGRLPAGEIFFSLEEVKIKAKGAKRQNLPYPEAVFLVSSVPFSFYM